MRLKDFETQLKKINPNFNIRQRNVADVVGLYLGDNYILRLSKGELHLYNHRVTHTPGIYTKSDQQKATEAIGGQKYGGLKRRGRFQALEMLVRTHLITSRQAQQICWGMI